VGINQNARSAEKVTSITIAPAKRVVRVGRQRCRVSELAIVLSFTQLEQGLHADLELPGASLHAPEDLFRPDFLREK